MEPIIEVRDLSLAYSSARGSTTALSGIDLDIRHGEFVSIIGPSGCGKSTLLSIIGGLLQPTAGSVRFKGAELREPTARIGYVFQDPVLLPWLSVTENVMLLRISEIRDSDFTNSRTPVSLIPGQSGQGWSVSCG